MTALLPSAPSYPRAQDEADLLAALEADDVTPDQSQALSWQDQALCSQTDPEAFFPEKSRSARDAKQVCNSCPVRDVCLQYALDNDVSFGVWGGTSEAERRRLKKRESEHTDSPPTS